MSRIMWGVETDPVTIMRQKLIEITKPSAEDFRNLSVVRANTKSKRKLAKKDLTTNTGGQE